MRSWSGHSGESEEGGDDDGGELHVGCGMSEREAEDEGGGGQTGWFGCWDEALSLKCLESWEDWKIVVEDDDC